MARLFIGVDPGLSGAIATVDELGEFLEIHDMPTNSIEVGGKLRQRLDVFTLLAVFSDFGEDQVALAVLEEVGPTPRDSRAGAFTFGATYGATRACMIAGKLPLELVRPQLWKRHFRIGKGKDEARATAASLLPAWRDQFARKKDDGRAEAALMALYARNLWKGGQ